MSTAQMGPVERVVEMEHMLYLVEQMKSMNHCTKCCWEQNRSLEGVVMGQLWVRGGGDGAHEVKYFKDSHHEV